MILRPAAVVALALVGACAGPPSEPAARVDPVSPPMERLDPDLVCRIDRVFQERFANVTGDDIKLSRFGYNRISPDRAHPRVFIPKSDAERERLAAVAASGWRTSVYAIGDWHGLSPVPHGPLAVGGDPGETREALAW
ncbi:MAG TPA: hypothetical protein VMU54_03900 [Planctomycetota bacterium]|nr:hypothetical protein [Planctomycetota bacterium]